MNANDITRTIAHLGTHEPNVADYHATNEKFLFVDGLLLDFGVPRNDITRERLEVLLEQGEVAVAA